MSTPKLLVDRATGSIELAEPLSALGLPVEVMHLEYGDIAFSGRGEKGAPLYIGIELKKIGELVTSLRTKRFQGHQLLGLTRDFDRRYLLIEGDFHSDTQGRTVVFRGPGRPKPLPGSSNAVTLEQEILNIQTRGGCWVRHTTTRKDTLRFIQACFRYWTDADLDSHKSHLAIYAPDLDRRLMLPISLKRQVAAQLPGIGYLRSQKVDAHFKSIQDMMNASVEEWLEVEGIGHETASKLVKACKDMDKPE